MLVRSVRLKGGSDDVSTWEPSQGASDEWYTPKYIFDALGCVFDMDVAAPEDGAPHVPARYHLHERSLETRWEGFVWMNPPFGGRNGLVPWLDKFFAYGNGIALTPDRTSAPWFRDAWSKADLVMFTPKIKFIKPDGTTGKQPGNGTALWASGEHGVLALKRAAHAGLGILAQPIAE